VEYLRVRIGRLNIVKQQLKISLIKILGQKEMLNSRMFIG
jgi:hypothetical protein